MTLALYSGHVQLWLASWEVLPVSGRVKVLGLAKEVLVSSGVWRDSWSKRERNHTPVCFLLQRVPVIVFYQLLLLSSRAELGNSILSQVCVCRKRYSVCVPSSGRCVLGVLVRPSTDGGWGAVCVSVNEYVCVCVCAVISTGVCALLSIRQRACSPAGLPCPGLWTGCVAQGPPPDVAGWLLLYLAFKDVFI